MLLISDRNTDKNDDWYDWVLKNFTGEAKISRDDS